MSSPYYPSSSRRRIVCLACHQKNITCEIHAQAPSMPCARCARKGHVCQYITVSDTPKPTPAPTKQSHSSSTSAYYPAPAPPPELPHTAPPPMHGRPRYSGGTYPDLSLASSGPFTPRTSQFPPSAGGYAHVQPQLQSQGYAYPQAPAAPAYPNTPYTSSNYTQGQGQGYPYPGQQNRG